MITSTPQLVEALKAMLDEADGREVNPSNYSHDDVSRLNDGYVMLFGAIELAIASLSTTPLEVGADPALVATPSSREGVSTKGVDPGEAEDVLALVQRIRHRYPLDGVGPITNIQRADILELCDIIEASNTGGGE